MTLRDTDILSLPDAPATLAGPPQYSMAEFIALCEKMLPYWNKERFSKPPPPFIGEPVQLDQELPSKQKER
jgi:hypothetical protein